MPRYFKIKRTNKKIISEELKEVKESYAIPRRSEIQEFEGDFEDEDLIEKEEMVVTVTREGYIKRTALSEYREQNVVARVLKA